MTSRTTTFLLSALLLTLLVLIGCENSKDLPLEAGIGGEATVGTLHEVVLPATEIKQVRTELNGGASDFIFVGQRRNLRAKALLLFDVFPDSATATQAELRFVIARHYGTGTMHIFARPVQEAWDEYEVRWSSFPAVDTLTALGEADWTVADSQQVSIPLDTAVVNGWMRGAVENHGLALLPAGYTEILFRLFSVETVNTDLAPYLWMRYTANGKVDSARIFPSADLFVASRPEPPEDGPYVVSGLVADRVLLKFDLSSIPSAATINSTQFEWSIDTTATFFEDSPILVALQRVQSYPWDLANLAFDTKTNVVRFYLTQGDDILTISSLDEIKRVTDMMQRLVYGVLSDNGFVLKMGDEDTDFGWIAFVRAPGDSTVGPRLIVTYTIPPTVSAP
ncbi:MAG TPA: DNRLRE domain-containing protein [Bacteroidetes bacterium]|nr:DNRLRE domain-containing protein [Bacteroidota bacterium]